MAISDEHTTTDSARDPVPEVGVDEGRCNGADSELPKTPDVLNGWSCLLNFAQSNDQQKVDTWKDELNNLLVFAGLFSAVITAFTIESYQWLRPDSAAISVQLLAQISLQLSSLTVSQGFINSTASPVYTPTATFQPSEHDVTINFLWFLSLTLSLLSAFFAIAAQQWLRSLPLPPNLPVQDAVRLQRSRQRALTICQVPSIIALLPVMLQIAVVLFLFGVYYLLRSLSHPITTAFALVAGIPFLLYAISLVLPLVWYDCPFKSPLIVSIAFVLNWAGLILGLVSAAFLAIPALVVGGLGSVLCGKCIPHFGQLRRHYMFDRLTLRILEAVAAVSEHVGYRLIPILAPSSDFWTRRQMRHMCQENESSISRSLGKALESAPVVIPPDQLGCVRQSLLALPVKERVSCVLKWALLHFGLAGNSFAETASNWSPVNTRVLDAVDASFARHYQSFFLDALPVDWSERDWIREVGRIPVVFAYLTQIVKAVDPGLRPTVVHTLLQACKSQRFKSDEKDLALDESSSDRFPAVYLFECTSDRTYHFSHDDVVDLVSIAQTRTSSFLAIDASDRELYRVSVQEIVLASCATAFVALEGSSPDFRDRNAKETVDLIRALDRFVVSEAEGMRFMGIVVLERPAQPFIVTLRAVNSICRSLLTMAEGGYLQPHDADALGQLVGHLLEACTGEEAFGDAAPVLTLLRELCSASQTEYVSPVSCHILDMLPNTSAPQLGLDDSRQQSAEADKAEELSETGRY